MSVRRILIFAPTLLVLLLLQSYFWVPTYEEQTRGNPDRLNEYIFASGGDANILNPILSADVPSSRVEAIVFEGLIDRNEDLRFRGRLADSWEIFEEAFFYVNTSVDIPGHGKLNPQQVADFLQTVKDNEVLPSPDIKATLDNISQVAVIPPQMFQSTHAMSDKQDNQKKSSIKISIAAPARIKLRLHRVDQDLFQNLSELLGYAYFESFEGQKYLKTSPAVAKEKLATLARELLPATEHNPVLIFHLRPNIKFHDGHILNADDVKFTYESIMNPNNLSPRIADYEPVKAVSVLDPLTVRITYKRLYSPALESWAMGVLPEHRLNAEALKTEARKLGKDPDRFSMRDSGFNRNPIGCGPYVFQKWKSDQYITLNRFDDYWEGPPNYKRYTFRIIPDLLTQEMEFYAGTIDSYGNPLGGVPPHQVQRLKLDPQYQHFSGLSLSYTYIGYNQRRKPFDDPRVRRALSMAIDVDKIIAYVLYDQAERITGPFAKQTEFYNPNIPSVPFDPQGALELLAQAGWKRNNEGWLEKDGQTFRFTLITNSGNDIRKAILAVAQDAWKQIGIDVRTDLLEWTVFIEERTNKADFDALILGWTTPINPDPFQVWHSSQANPYQLNFVGFQNKTADELIIKIRQEYDPIKQVEYCHRFHEIIAREQPYTFLYIPKWTAILDKRIVLKKSDKSGNVIYEKIKPTQTGDYGFHFNKWIKLAEVPDFTL
jgi:ABC-type transport system substrate-binding protein